MKKSFDPEAIVEQAALYSQLVAESSVLPTEKELITRLYVSIKLLH